MPNRFTYQPYFELNILHEYYLPEELAVYNGSAAIRDDMLPVRQRAYDVHQDIQIIPTQRTKQRLKNLQFIWKPSPRGFQVLGKVETRPDRTFIPFLDMSAPESLRFKLFISNPDFANFTNLRMDRNESPRERHIYLFSTTANHVITVPGGNDLVYLSRLMPPFRTDLAYESGELIQNGLDILEAIRDLDPGTFDAADWINRYTGLNPQPRFVTTADRHLLRPNRFRLDVSSMNEASCEVVVRSLAGIEMYRQAFSSLQPGEDISSCNIDLRELEVGLYLLTVNRPNGVPVIELNSIFYLDQESFDERAFAVIDIVHDPTVNLGAYRWFDQNDDNRLLQPSYLIRWKNRSTFWRYYLAEAPTSFSSPHVQAFVLSPTETLDDVLESLTPIPLTEISRRVEATLDGDLRLLPNAKPHSIFEAGGRLFSEINIGGGLGPPSSS